MFRFVENFLKCLGSILVDKLFINFKNLFGFKVKLYFLLGFEINNSNHFVKNKLWIRRRDLLIFTFSIGRFLILEINVLCGL